MARDWIETDLGELIEIRHGFAFQGDFIHDEPKGDVLLTPGNFGIGGGFKWDKLKYYDGHTPENFVLCEGDLLVSMTDLSKQADTLGYPAFVPSPPDGRSYLHNQRLGRVFAKTNSEIDLRYIYYVMCSKDYRNEVLAGATGTTVKHTSPERIKRYHFRLPPLTDQQAIAQILGTLDDKIELNRRMNETLEAMARTLFKSWFVDFDPVRARVDDRDTGLPEHIANVFPSAFDDSEIGAVPRSWTVTPLPDFIEVNPRRELRKGTPAPYLEMASMPTKGHAPENVVERPFGSGTRFANGDTLVARITPCLENGKTAYVDFLEEGATGWGSTEYIVMNPRPALPNEFVYYLARSTRFRDFAIQNMTGTSGRQRMPAKALSSFLCALPPREIAEKFGNVVQPLVARVTNAVREARALAELRDALLPRLMSGELQTSESREGVR